MNDVLKKLAMHRLIPVIAIDRADQAAPLADALSDGGLPVAEITFRTAAAEEAIRQMAKRPHMLVGAGTVLDVETVKRAVGAGAAYIVSPGFSQNVVRYCLDQNLPVFPGCVTPTEIMVALDHGITTIKFFPAETVGGLRAVKALAAPFAQVRFIPTGGITEANLAEYLAFPPVVACGGSWMVTKELLAANDFSRITSITTTAIEIVQKSKPF